MNGFVLKNVAFVGITDFAQGELGTSFTSKSNIRESLEIEEVFGTIEAVKLLPTCLCPPRKIVEINPLLEENPELVNTDPMERMADQGRIERCFWGEQTSLQNSTV